MRHRRRFAGPKRRKSRPVISQGARTLANHFLEMASGQNELKNIILDWYDNGLFESDTDSGYLFENWNDIEDLQLLNPDGIEDPTALGDQVLAAISSIFEEKMIKFINSFRR